MINDIVKKGKCYGCRSCEQVCPKNAITMVYDSEGFLVPAVNEKKCIKCKMCIKSCQAFNDKKVLLSKPMAAYAAVGMDKDFISNSASGGIAAVIAKRFLQINVDNGMVFGSMFSDDCKNVYHMCIDNVSSISRIQGSKYVQSDVRDTYHNVKEALIQGKKVLYFGTPCQIAGLKMTLSKDYKSLFCVDLLCSGVPSPKLWEKYIDELSNKYAATITDINFREKSKGWGYNNTKIFLNNQTIMQEPSSRNIWYKIFSLHIINRKSCNHCKYSSMKRVGDITLGDFWGIKYAVKGFKSNEGASKVLINNEKGMTLIKDVFNEMEYKKIPVSDAIRWSLIFGIHNHKKRDEFLNEAFNTSLEETYLKFKLDKKDIFQKIYSSWKGKREKILFVLRKLIYR